MSAIEITLPLAVTGGGWFLTTITMVWALSRKTQNWDDAESHEKTLYGNPREGIAGVVQRVASLEDAVGELTTKVKLLVNALDAHGSGEHQITEGVRRKIREHASAVYEEVIKARKAVIAEQTGRFHTPALPPRDDTFVKNVLGAIEEDDPFERRSDPGKPPKKR